MKTKKVVLISVIFLILIVLALSLLIFFDVLDIPNLSSIINQPSMGGSGMGGLG